MPPGGTSAFLRGDGTWSAPTTFDGTTAVAGTSVTTPELIAGGLPVVRYATATANLNIYFAFPGSVIVVIMNTGVSTITLTLDSGGTSTTPLSAGATAEFVKTTTAQFSRVY
jgi:hypothetical protein